MYRVGANSRMPKTAMGTIDEGVPSLLSSVLEKQVGFEVEGTHSTIWVETSALASKIQKNRTITATCIEERTDNARLPDVVGESNSPPEITHPARSESSL